MRTSIFVRWLTILTIVAGMGIIPATMAQTSSDAENLTLPRGSVFEIIARHSVTNPAFSWIFSLDGTFVEAKRTAFFRTRFIDEGLYQLVGDIASADGSVRLQKTLRIDVPATGNMPGTKSGAIIATTPALDAKGRIVLDSAQSVIGFFPVDGIQALTLDLDTTRDNDGDGDPSNDNDVHGTFFETKATPLHVWFTEPVTDTTVVLRSGAQLQSIRIVNRTIATQEDELERRTVEIVAQDLGDGTTQFSVEYPKGTPDFPVLLQWDFGDGKTSLLSTPQHTYAANNRYTVKVSIRNLQTSAIVEGTSATVQIESVSAVPPSDTPEDQEQTQDRGALLSTVLLIVKVLLIAIVSIAVGLGSIFAVSRLVKKRSAIPLASEDASATKDVDALEETQPMEIVEATAEEEVPPLPTEEPVVEKEPEPVAESMPEEKPAPEPEPPAPQTEPETTPEPLPDWLQPAKSAPQPKKQTPPKKKEVPSVEPSASSAPVPPWLASQTTEQEAPPAETVQPAAPAADEPKAEPTPVPPTPQEPPQESVANGAEGPLPDWLKPRAEENKLPVEEPAAPSEPPAPPPPEPSAAPPKPVAPPPAEVEGPTPPWLAQASASDAPTPIMPAQSPAQQNTDPAPQKNVQESLSAEPDDEEPIAFLRADSVEEQDAQSKKEPPAAPPPPSA
ncbi:MAG: PKD domain-containing protein [Candidatus Peribacteraceae bacterium]|jgi:PKD repeat protein